MAGSNLFTGTLDLLILQALRWGPLYGYAIGRWIRETGGGPLHVEEGAPYPALHRLEKADLLAVDWGQSATGRQAKFYEPAPAGRRHLAAAPEIKRERRAKLIGSFVRDVRIALRGLVREPGFSLVAAAFRRDRGHRRDRGRDQRRAF